MRRSGFRAGYHPTPMDLDSLRVLDKKKRTYIDKNGNQYSSRAVQEARNGYLSIEHAAVLRKTGGWGDLLTFTKRKKLGLSMPILAREWERLHNVYPGSVLFDWEHSKTVRRQFQRDLRKLIQMATQEDAEDDYEVIDEFMEDHFGLGYEELQNFVS